MPRPASDLQKVNFRLGPDDLDALDRIAEALGLVVQAGQWKGRPDRTEALRRAIEMMAEEVTP